MRRGVTILAIWVVAGVLAGLGKGAMAQKVQGFLYDGRTFSTIDVPGASYTEATGINDAGQIVGFFVDSKGVHGFLDVKGTLSTIAFPGGGYTAYTEAAGINNAGQIVGTLSDSKATHGFLYTGDLQHN